ncbi:MAG: AAA family ATPase [Rikenellaceae bacterium]
MYKIDEVKLTNFKFFHGDKVISLKRKHAIIYGENGSGKSSIYWGLHCFLHSTLKHDIESVQKYFNPLSETNKESIRNRYAMSDGKNSGV